MLIELKDVVLRHNDHPILDGVNFNVDDNDFIYIIGKVGSGKSSLLKALYGELPITSGEANILGLNLKKAKRNKIQLLRRQLGIVFQDFHLLHELTVEQNLDFVLKATGWKKKARPERIKQVLERVELYDKKDHFPHELSGGEQQRVCIARALLNKPKVVLADEPIGNLDPDTSRQIMRILQSVREQGSAVVMVTHNMNLLNEFPGVIYRCSNGTISEAQPQDIIE